MFVGRVAESKKSTANTHKLMQINILLLLLVHIVYMNTLEHTRSLNIHQPSIDG